MRRVSIALLISVFAMYGSAAHAVDFPNGLYWGGSGGSTDHSDGCDALSVPAGFGSATRCSDSDFGWQIFLGYQVMKWLSLEGGYAGLGGTNVTAINASSRSDVDGFTLNAVVTAPLLEKFGIYGTVGAFFWDADLTTGGAVNQDPISTSDSGTDAFYGVGLRFPLTETIGMNLEAKRFIDVGSNEVGTTDINLLSAGLLFRF